MDSPFSSSPPPPALCEPEPELKAEAGEGGPGRTATRPGAASREDVVLVAGFGNAVAADYAAFVRRGDAVLVADGRIRALAEGGGRTVALDECVRSTADDWGGRGRGVSLVVFLSPRPTERERRGLADLLRASNSWPVRFVGIIGSFRVHLDDPVAEEAERFALGHALTSGLEPRVAVFRPGNVLSLHSGVSRFLRRLAPVYPLVARRLGTCFIDGVELFAAIEAERLREGRPSGFGADATASLDPAGRALGRRRRAYTLLGANLPWREVLSRHRVSPSTPGQSLMTAAAQVLSWLGVGQAVALAVTLLAGRFAWARPWRVHTLRPRSMRELLSLCHRGNIDRVRVVGYNNGVNHFGHRYPGRTIVSTVCCRRTVRVGPGRLKGDCGATVRDALDCLSGDGEDLYVIPNYSYVCLGTAYFVPIHGSSVDFATIADTVDRVVLYDPDRDRIVSAARHEGAFTENVYNLRSRVVVLRLYLRTKPKSSYLVRRETWRSPSAGDLLGVLRDRDATNVEIRQAHSASAEVTVSRYYTGPDAASGPALELPRDALGRLWDRLEENPVSSFLMHALSRHLAWHTELFFTPEEFERFWSTHAWVPLRKIQLRYIRRDGMPHSPFRDEDCVSADLFLFRTSKAVFDAYLKTTFPSVRTNPGKHSN
jgi:hypothetical protein